jgi:dihydrofolate synthase/folylpolyglutamate synthase
MAPEAVVFTAAPSPRAAPPAALAASWRGPNRVIASAVEAVAVAREIARADGVVVVCGSLYLVGEVRPPLVAERR